MFPRIKIDHFRGIKHAEINDFSRVNIFFGKNNSGKSSVLEAIFIVTGQSNPLLPFSVNRMRGYSSLEEQDIANWFYNLNMEKPIHISVDVQRNLEITPSKSKTIDLTNANLSSNTNVDSHYGINVEFAEGLSTSLVINAGDKKETKVNVSESYKEDIVAVYLPANNFMFGNTLVAFSQLVKSKQEQEVVSVLKEIEPKIQNISLVGDEIMVDIGLDRLLPIKLMGDGIRKVFAVVLSMYECRNGVLIIDELENGLHHSAMLTLWKAVLKAAEQNNTQVFISTHNIDSLKGLNTLLDEGDYRKYQDDVVSYKLVKQKDDTLWSYRYAYPEFSFSINQEIEMR